MSLSSYNSPVWSPGSLRLLASRAGVGGDEGVLRLIYSSMKKPPEPLRWAMADFLASSVASSHHATISSTVLLSEASRILRVRREPAQRNVASNVKDDLRSRKRWLKRKALEASASNAGASTSAQAQQPLTQTSQNPTARGASKY